MDTVIFREEKAIYAIILMLGKPEKLFDDFCDEKILQLSISQGDKPIVTVYYVDGSTEIWI